MTAGRSREISDRREQKLELASSRCRPLLLGLCTAAMAFAAAHGVARANSFTSFSPPTPVSKRCRPHLPPVMSGNLAIGAGTASSMSGFRGHMSWPRSLMRYGFPAGGSGMNVAGSGPTATGGIEDGAGGVCRPSDGFQYNLPSTFSGCGSLIEPKAEDRFPSGLY